MGYLVMTLHHLASKWLKVNFICEMFSTNSYGISEAPNLGPFLQRLQPRIHGNFSIQWIPWMYRVSILCILQLHKEIGILQR